MPIAVRISFTLHCSYPFDSNSIAAVSIISFFRSSCSLTILKLITCLYNKPTVGLLLSYSISKDMSTHKSVLCLGRFLVCRQNFSHIFIASKGACFIRYSNDRHGHQWIKFLYAVSIPLHIITKSSPPIFPTKSSCPAFCRRMSANIRITSSPFPKP